ncbi:hypothetical protein [Flavobacterium sp. 2]|uniref:hypothetical protein n=1 Tax=Flavobacterium sp. 2 TaxID=308053 RepID=UPI003CF3FD0E
MELNINLVIAVIGASVTLIGYYVTRYLERKKEIEFQIRNKKIPIYEEFFQFYFKVVFNTKNKNDEKLSDDDMVLFFQQFNQKAIIWFPDNILLSYINWKRELSYFSGNNTPENLKNLILKQEDLMKEFRKDIGHKNSKISKGDISSLYINGLDNYF